MLDDGGDLQDVGVHGMHVFNDVDDFTDAHHSSEGVPAHDDRHVGALSFADHFVRVEDFLAVFDVDGVSQVLLRDEGKEVDVLGFCEIAGASLRFASDGRENRGIGKYASDGFIPFLQILFHLEILTRCQVVDAPFEEVERGTGKVLALQSEKLGAV